MLRNVRVTCVMWFFHFKNQCELYSDDIKYGMPSNRYNKFARVSTLIFSKALWESPGTIISLRTLVLDVFSHMRRSRFTATDWTPISNVFRTRFQIHQSEAVHSEILDEHMRCNPNKSNDILDNGDVNNLDRENWLLIEALESYLNHQLIFN